MSLTIYRELLAVKSPIGQRPAHLYVQTRLPDARTIAGVRHLRSLAVLATAVAAALPTHAAAAPRAAAPFTAIPVPIGAGYLADSGDAASAGRLWRRSDGTITTAPGDLIIRGIRADGTAIAFATYRVYGHDELTVEPIRETPWFFGRYARIAPDGTVTPFTVDLHPAPTPMSGTYGWYESGVFHEPLPGQVDWRESVYGWPQAWSPQNVSQNGHVLWAVLRDQYDEWGVTAAGGGVPVFALREDADDFDRTYGIDDRGRVAYSSYDTASAVMTSGVTGGVQLSGVCMRGISSDGYVLVTVPESCGETAGFRLLAPDGSLAWELSAQGLPVVRGGNFRPQVLRGGLVVGAGTSTPFETFLLKGGRIVDVRATLLPALPAGSRITQFLDANRRGELLVRTATGDVQGTYILSARRPITGNVRDASGAPVAGALVTATPVPAAGPTRAGARAVSVRTDARGAFSIDVEGAAAIVAIERGCFGATAGRRCARTTRVDLSGGAPAPLVARVDRPTRPVAQIGRGVVRLRVARGRTRLPVRCLRVTGACAVKVAVVVRGTRLAGGTATIAAAAKGGVALRLTPAGTARLARGAVAATATVRSGGRAIAIRVRLARA